MVWVKSGVQLMVWSEVVCVGVARQLSLPQGQANLMSKCRIIPVPAPFLVIFGLVTHNGGSSTWRLPELPEDVLKVEVKITSLLRSRLVGPVPGVLPTFLGCNSFCFSTGVNWSNLASEKCMSIMWVCLSTSDWGTSPFWHLSKVWGPCPQSCLHGKLLPPRPPLATEATCLDLGSSWVIGWIFCALEFYISILNRVKISKISMVCIY